VLEAYPASDPIRQKNHAICIDGLNAAGLSIAVLYQVRAEATLNCMKQLALLAATFSAKAAVFQVW
jgi:hypothetical protein